MIFFLKAFYQLVFLELHVYTPLIFTSFIKFYIFIRKSLLCFCGLKTAEIPLNVCHKVTGQSSAGYLYYFLSRLIPRFKRSNWSLCALTCSGRQYRTNIPNKCANLPCALQTEHIKHVWVACLNPYTCSVHNGNPVAVIFGISLSFIFTCYQKLNPCLSWH